MSRSLMRLRQLLTTLVGLGAWLLTAAEDEAALAVTLADANFPTKCTENGKSASTEEEPVATEQPVIIIDLPTVNNEETATTQQDEELVEEEEVKTEAEIPTTTTPAPYIAPKKEKQPEFYVDDA